MIISPFSSKILVKDLELPASWTQELEITLKFLMLDKEENCSLSKSLKDNNLRLIYRYDEHKSSKPYIINEGTAKKHKVIEDLRNIFIDGFCELNREYNNQYDEQYLRKTFLFDSGNFAILKKGQRVGLHNHPSIAFAIFYLTDVDNENDGGELILYDPSFNQNKHFSPKRDMKIATKKNRLIIGPANVWHEVTPYYGNYDRLCAVIDLKR